MHLKKYGIVWLLALFILMQVIDLLRAHPVWWDGAVYIGMAKYLFSGGQIGLWEEFRPLFWPLLLGSFWKLGLNILVIGTLLQMLFSTGIVYITYKIAQKYFSWQYALLASFFVAFNPTFFFFWTKMYSEIPALFFCLLAIFFFLEKKFAWVGFFSALAFLTKFPQGLVLAVFLGVLLLNKKIKDAGTVLFFFIVTSLPFFILNIAWYQAPFHTLILAKEIIKTAGIWIFQKPWYFYVLNLLKENIWFSFAIFGLLPLLKKDTKAVVGLGFLAFFLYFSSLAHKEMRFAIAFIPLLAIMAVSGISKKIKPSRFVLVGIVGITLLQFLVMLPPEPLEDFERIKEFAAYPLEDKEGEILTSHPLVNLYQTKSVKPLYAHENMLDFNKDLIQFWREYIQKNKVSYIFFDTCEGGTLCNPKDISCENERQQFINFLKEYNIFYSKGQGRCEYFIFALQ